MNPSPEDLEKLIHKALRALPEQSAPQGLESRVFAELARRAALPWWRRSYLQWPLAVRVGFVILSAAACAALIGAWILIGRSGALAQVASQFGQDFQWLAVARSVGSSLLQAGAEIVRSVPPLWFYAALAALAACYATLAGVSAAAYRAFSPTR